ncbi:MAG TPA: MnhB domain-containing protein [Mycobacteriales bacterium]|nr:MnhB domain-containing protein [Mycobacteriales bacterium]
MSRSSRLIVVAVAAGCVGILFVLAFLDLPDFGSSFHPYRDLSVPTAIRQHAPNVVSSVNFDQRGLDTLGEETILFASVMGAAMLLRPNAQEKELRSFGGARVLPLTRLLGYVMLPVTLVLGLDTVVHGHITPGGGFQGGVILATGLHLLYLTGSYPALLRVRPVRPYEISEAVGAAGFAAIGVAGILTGSAFLTNIVPLGRFRDLASAGTVPFLNIAVGIEVASGMVTLLAAFFEQALAIEPDDR